MIVLVDVELADVGSGRPDRGTEMRIDLLDTSQIDDDAIVLGTTQTEVQGIASEWLATAELVAGDVDPRADLTVSVRVAASGHAELADGDWITMQHVPVAPALAHQRVVAPVRRVGSGGVAGQDG